VDFDLPADLRQRLADLEPRMAVVAGGHAVTGGAGSFTNIETYDAQRRRLEPCHSERLNYRRVLFHVRLSVGSP